MSTAGHVRKSNKLNLTRRHCRHWSSSVLSVTLLLFDMIQHKQKCSQQLGITFIVLLITQWVLPDHHLGILLRNFEPVHLNLMKYSDRSRSNPTFLSRLTHPSGLSILLPLEGQAVELGGASLPLAGLSHGPAATPSWLLLCPACWCYSVSPSPSPGPACWGGPAGGRGGGRAGKPDDK